MTETSTGIDAPPMLTTAKIAGYSIAAAVVVLFAFYGTYFAHTLVVLGPEQAALDAAHMGGSGLYAVLLSGWQVIAGESVLAARALSLLAGVLAIVIAFNIACRLTGDVVMAAFLVLPFVLFPPMVAAMSVALPHALFVLIAMLMLRLMQTQTSFVVTGFIGILAIAAALLHPLGPVVVPLWIALCSIVLNQFQRAVVMFGFAGIAVLLNATIADVPMADPDLSAGAHGTVLKAIIVPYAMMIVATVFSAMAMASGNVREGFGKQIAIGVFLGPVLAVLVVISALATDAVGVGQWVTEAVVLFPLVLLAPWPLIFWARRVMPQVKSLIAWIAFPVIMYSCFWVILGPVDPGRFPYSHRASSQLPPGN